MSVGWFGFELAALEVPGAFAAMGGARDMSLGVGLLTWPGMAWGGIVLDLAVDCGITAATLLCLSKLG